MSLAEVAKQGPIAGKPISCGACLLVAALPKGEAAALNQMFADPEWRYTAISDALLAEGYTVADQTLSRHARGLCGTRKKLR